MSSFVVRQSLETRLTDFLALQDWGAVLINIYNDRSNPPTTSDWLTLEYVNADEEQLSTGAPADNIFRETGEVLIHYVVPTKTSWETAVSRLDEIRAHFRATVIDNVTIDSVQPPMTEPGSSLAAIRGNFWGASILVNYETDIRG
jgi:hypothetical protein